MKPILLIYPPYEGKIILKSRMPYPIGLLYIASYLEEKGVKTEVIDFCYPPDRVSVPKPKAMKLNQRYFRFGWSDEKIKVWLKKNLGKYHNIVGVSSLMSSTYMGGYKVVKIIKEIDSNKKVVMGGPHATAFPEHVRNNSLVDDICIGEGEEQFYRYIIEGSFGENTKIKDMDSLPFPNKELLINSRKEDSMIVTFSRGCPHKCSFCGSHLVQGRMWRHKSVSRVLTELKYYIDNWGIKNFAVEDDNLSPMSKGLSWLKELCKGIIDELPKIKLHVPHGIPVYAIADKELCDLLWRAGFRNMVFPLESTDPDVLKDMNKEFTPDNWLIAIKNWNYEKNHPAEIILGYPFVDTISSMLKTMMDISKEKGRVWASHFRLNKGTSLFDRCLEAGYIDKDYDPINTQSFYLETERFCLSDLKELMRISKGINFGTERSFDVFTNNPAEAKFKDYQFIGSNNIVIGGVVATGNFSFRRAQDSFTSLLLSRLSGTFSKMKVKYSPDNSSLIFAGAERSRVYKELSTMMYNKKDKKRKILRDYL